MYVYVIYVCICHMYVCMYISARAGYEGAGLWGLRERRPALLPQLLAAAADIHSEDAEPPGGDHRGARRPKRPGNHGVGKTVCVCTYVCMHVRIYLSIYVSTYKCTMYVRMYLLYVCIV